MDHLIYCYYKIKFFKSGLQYCIIDEKLSGTSAFFFFFFRIGLRALSMFPIFYRSAISLGPTFTSAILRTRFQSLISVLYDPFIRLFVRCVFFVTKKFFILSINGKKCTTSRYILKLLYYDFFFHNLKLKFRQFFNQFCNINIY